MQCKNMSPSEKASVVSQLQDDLASVMKESDPLNDDPHVQDQLKNCKDDFEKCNSYILDLLNQLDKGINTQSYVVVN